MPRRSKMSRKRSKRSFRKNAQRVHPKNVLPQANPMRGGIRL